MPRRLVDEVNVAALNKRVKAIENGNALPGLIRVGGVGGLALNVRLRSYNSGEAISASWVLRRTFEGRRRDFALGAWPEVSLAQARERARGMMDKLWRGIDPLEEKRAERQAKTLAAVPKRIFREAAQDHFDLKVSSEINARDAAKWFNDLETFVFPVIGDMPVDQIETAHVLEITQRPHTRYGSDEEQHLWEAVPERARRCLKKVEAILNRELSERRIPGPNPARWKDHLSGILPKPEKLRAKEKQPALPVDQVAGFVKTLRAREPSPSSSALEFLILTAARSGEIRGAVWSEIDMDRRLWTIPAARMKMKEDREDHRVPLSEPALDLLKRTARFAGTDLIWPGNGLKKPMSDQTLASLIKKMHAAEIKAGGQGWLDPKSKRPVVPHGFRSTFRDWAAEMTTYPSEMAELALAHNVGSAVERAYRRGDQMDKRRAMMDDWAAFALGRA